MAGLPNCLRGDSVMDRRTFVGTVGGALFTLPLAIEAQQAGATASGRSLRGIPNEVAEVMLDFISLSLRGATWPTPPSTG